MVSGSRVPAKSVPAVRGTWCLQVLHWTVGWRCLFPHAAIATCPIPRAWHLLLQHIRRIRRGLPALHAALEADFWKLTFEAIVKVFQFSVIAIALLVSALGMISDGGSDIVTTLAYPVAVIVTQCTVIAYWILVPLWERVAESYRITDVPKNPE